MLAGAHQERQTVLVWSGTKEDLEIWLAIVCSARLLLERVYTEVDEVLVSTTACNGAR